MNYKDLKDGIHERIDLDGSKFVFGIRNGYYHGEVRSYAANGKLLGIDVFENGRGILHTYYNSGRVKSMGQLVGNEPCGIIIGFSDDEGMDVVCRGWWYLGKRLSKKKYLAEFNPGGCQSA